jgi:hypothetical protein
MGISITYKEVYSNIYGDMSIRNSNNPLEDLEKAQWFLKELIKINKNK